MTCGHKGWNGLICDAEPHSGPVHVNGAYGEHWECIHRAPDHSGPCEPPKKWERTREYFMAILIRDLIRVRDGNAAARDRAESALLLARTAADEKKDQVKKLGGEMQRLQEENRQLHEQLHVADVNANWGRKG